MQSSRDIKRRMRSIKNTQQITLAMEAVSASKMRRSQEYALSARPYAEHALRLLSNVNQKTDEKFHPLLERPLNKFSKGIKKNLEKKVCLMIISSDKGLCGGYNNNIFRAANQYIVEHQNENPDDDIDIIAVGKKTKRYFEFQKKSIMSEFVDFGDYIKLEQTLPLAQKIIKIYLEKKYSFIMCTYTNFISTLKQEVVIRQILPITKKGIEKIVQGIGPESGRYVTPNVTNNRAQRNGQEKNNTAFFYKERPSNSNYEYKFEPSPKKVLDQLLPLLVKIQVHHMILESNASEHSARMIAMRNASENAQNILAELTLFYNKARQTSITREIAEVVSHL